jgi:predicted enzyme related to lactoylglutathione lyase
MHGNVSFVELGTAASETDPSRRFFERVFGWPFHPMPQGGGWFKTPTIRVGLHGSDSEPRVYLFFEVSDLEQAITLVRDAGGESGPPLAEEPGFGRFAHCRDPQGIPFGLHQSAAA